MQMHSSSTPIELSQTDWEKLGDGTEGYSGSDLAALTLEALFQPVRDMHTATHWRQLTGKRCSLSFFLSFFLSHSLSFFLSLSQNCGGISFLLQFVSVSLCLSVFL